MILIDANVLMYAAGAQHPSKAPSVALLQRVARGEVDAAVDAEVLQEVLHRYRAIGRWAEGCLVYDSARRLFGVVHPVTGEMLDEARRLMDVYGHLTARDALHAAACQVTAADAICSFDRDFDVIAGLKRVEPQDLL